MVDEAFANGRREFLAALWPVQGSSSKAITGDRLSGMYNSLRQKRAAAADSGSGSRAIATNG